MQAIMTVPVDLATDHTTPARCKLSVRMSLVSTGTVRGGNVSNY